MQNDVIKLNDICSTAPNAQAAHPVAHQMVVRALHFSLESNPEDDWLMRGSGARRLLSRYVGLSKEDLELSSSAVREKSLMLIQELSDPAIATDAEPLKQLANGLANALRFSEAEYSLLLLALYAHDNRDLQNALDLVGHVDSADAANVFAHVLGMDSWKILGALRKENPLRKMTSNEVIHGVETAHQFLRFTLSVQKVLRGETPTVDAVLSLFFRSSPPPRLQMSDFEGHGITVSLLQRFLGKSLESGQPAVNILLYGSPGTGKTELTRAMATALGVQLMEVPTVDDDKDPLPPWKRLTAYSAAQEVLRAHAGTILLFDEVEDVFPRDVGMGFMGQRSSGDRHKGWLTSILESNAKPAFWVCNTIDQIDPAYLRRFDMVIELTKPRREVREKMVQQLFAGLPVPTARLIDLLGESALAPAHLERLAGVLRTLAPANETEGVDILDHLTRQTLHALDVRHRPIKHARPLPYRPDCVTTNVDLGALTEALQTLPVARICLYGPPGTGKSEWARHLAERLGIPLHVKRASDLLSKFVGENERLIRAAFESAERDDAMLLIDEADGLLRSREGAQSGWEVSMVNEVLTCMESFQGIFVASTNLMAKLDAASNRRFDFKVEFGYLKAHQSQVLFKHLLEGLGLEGEVPDTLANLRTLTPGDFANVYRQSRLMAEYRTPAKLLHLLDAEQSAKQTHGTQKRIGFV